MNLYSLFVGNALVRHDVKNLSVESIYEILASVPKSTFIPVEGEIKSYEYDPEILHFKGTEIGDKFVYAVKESSKANYRASKLLNTLISGKINW